jgi:hypothetical protein
MKIKLPFCTWRKVPYIKIISVCLHKKILKLQTTRVLYLVVDVWNVVYVLLLICHRKFIELHCKSKCNFLHRISNSQMEVVSFTSYTTLKEFPYSYPFNVFPFTVVFVPSDLSCFSKIKPYPVPLTCRNIKRYHYLDYRLILKKLLYFFRSVS